MRLLARLDRGSGKPNKSLWPEPSPSSSYPSSLSPSPTSSLSSTTESPTSPPSTPPSPISYFDPFEQPKSPMHWTWTCHICNRNWRIGTTSRCLHCSHRMCMPEEARPLPPLSGRRKINLSNELNTNQPLSSLLSAEESDVRRPMLPLQHGADLDRHRYYQYLKRHFRRSRIKQDRKRKIKYCRSQFDYAGWEDWNEWRRDVKQFGALERKYEDGAENGDESDDSMSTIDEAEDEENEAEIGYKGVTTLDDAQKDKTKDEDEDEDVDTFKLVPATGRLHVVASSTPATRKESKISLAWNCWNDCDFPAHCIHARNERKRREASLNRIFL